MPLKVIIWDNDGSVQGSVNPNDASSAAKVILPNVEKVMNLPGIINVICSGFKSPESEKQNFEPEPIIGNFKLLMSRLPIQAAVFSPTIGGVACYAIIKHNETIQVRKADEDARYRDYIGKFKKPDIGMLVVIQDLLLYDFGIAISNQEEILFIGDTCHDREAASTVGIPFLEANIVHNLPDSTKFLDYIQGRACINY